MKVLLVGDLESVHVHRLASGLRDLGLAVSAAGFERGPVASVAPVDLQVGRIRGDARFAAGIPTLARAIRAIRPDVVNAHYLSSYGLMAATSHLLAFPRRRGAKLVQTAWGTDLLVTPDDSAIRRVMARLALGQADLVTGDSADVEQAAAALAPRVPFHRFIFGPSASLFARERDPQRIVISTRRLDPDTRVPLIIEAFRLAAAAEPDRLSGWRLIIAGAGSEQAHVEAAAAGVAGVELVGQLAAEDLQALLAQAQIAVSVPVSDATSAAVLEAMAMGVLPVVNDLPANREWIDTNDGIIVSRDPSAAELAQALIAGIARPIDVNALRGRVREVAWELELTKLVERWRAL